ncbi:hypothetical protein [Peribacillus huizhouensis]|uniref:Anionic cell wall polymer biosynthesis LytR-Cps2A-Psr (LCP) family protein n=1 Tax=Peribacillus huizhouensis TaxID=1501239 RepID=A0ABR6CLK6_9BACI|nr:hypothetical protein [Peribacillus huizhouensis]MBA9025927.1 anionic cell wall polymer biosynthesis LytR-Cps2A-Psr (LCP) family protein [Peribacillus huizhouensis]
MDRQIVGNYVVNLPKILGVADPYIDTNVDIGTILAMGKGLIAGNSKQMESLRIPIKDSYVNERVNVGSVLKIDYEKNRQALKAFLSQDNERPTSQEKKE